MNEHGYYEDLSKLEITKEMKQRMREAIAQGFTQLIVVPGIEGTKSYIGKDLKDTKWDLKDQEYDWRPKK